MTPEDFADFFLGMAGAGGAFIGLLFVAISIHPDSTFRRPTASGVPRQFLAEATLVTLGNGFVVSSVALIPGVNAGWVALGLGSWGVVAAGRLIELLTRSHRHSATTPRLHLLRVASLSLVALVVFAAEAVLGVSLLQQPASEAAWSGLALVIVAIDALGLARAWILLGDPRQGWSGWLNPLRDRASPSAPADSSASSGRASSRPPRAPAEAARATIDDSRRRRS